ncbi:general substrate transporter [Cadophora sp. DSE1049]|nr:general substrate transporter [Cadophora sp. DSE1049]
MPFFGGLLSLPSFVEQFPRIDTVSTTGSKESENARIEGTVVALYTVGCMFGALSCFKLGDKFGRLRTIAIGCTFIIIGSILLSTSFSLGQLIVGRLDLGLGFGAISATVPWIDLGFYFTDTSVSWRFPLAFPIVFALIILAFLPFLPDSPRWLVKKGRIEEARAVMAILEDVDENSPTVEEDIVKMQYSLEEMGKGSFKELLSNKEDRLLNRTLLPMFATFSQQINGIGVIGFYTTTIFEQFIGLSPTIARILSGSIYIWQLLCCFVTFWTVDRIGRRKLMMFGVVGMGACASIIAGAVSNAENSETCAMVAAVFVFLFAAFFGIGALGINYLYGTEVAPLAFRVPIYALSTTTLWIFNFLVVEVTPVGFANIGYKYYIVFACTNLLLLLPIIYFFLPETQQRSLEDMDTVFREAKNPFDVVKVSRHMKKIPASALGASKDRGIGRNGRIWDDEKLNEQKLENV